MIKKQRRKKRNINVTLDFVIWRQLLLGSRGAALSPQPRIHGHADTATQMLAVGREWLGLTYVPCTQDRAGAGSCSVAGSTGREEGEKREGDPHRFVKTEGCTKSCRDPPQITHSVWMGREAASELSLEARLCL